MTTDRTSPTAAAWGALDVRPYQLLCCVCRMGRRDGDQYRFEARLDEILAAVRADPNLPVTLRCNVDTVFRYQNPGREFDTPEGELFNDKRDLDVVHTLGLVPGDTRPALEMFNRIFKDIPACAGICGYADVTSGEWAGCPLCDSGNYERGHDLGVAALIPPRPQEEKATAKEQSASAMYSADVLHIRPHHLMCMTCFHGGREHLEPIQEDNLFEAIDILQNNPDMPVKLIAGPCMICPPCSKYDARNNLCIGAIGIGLRDQKKDLDVLQLLGMKYGDTMPARQLLRRLYERVHSTRQICGYGDGIVRGQEWTICGGPDGSPNYKKGRAAGMGVVRRGDGSPD